jgi:hypothetical protein
MRKRKAATPKIQKVEEEIQNIDRFAGSSEEESSTSDDDEVEAEQSVSNKGEDHHQSRKEASGSSSEDDDNNDDDDDNDDGGGSKSNESTQSDNDAEQNDEESEDEGIRHDGFDADDDQSDADDDEDDGGVELTSGMANAMTRILNSNLKQGPSVVLSKTKTPLQVMAEKEKKQQNELSEKVRRNREKRLSAMVIPEISAREIERERTHRRIATRGIVALFNAIAKHQQHANGLTTTTTTTSEDAASKKKETKLTKTAFLEQIKQAAINRNKSLDERNTFPAKMDKTAPTNESKWNALKDDYMMDSKKNWDEESSSEEDEKVVDAPVKKRHKIRS